MGKITEKSVPKYWERNLSSATASTINHK